MHPDKPRDRESQELVGGLTERELEEQTAHALPDRQAMSTISTDVSGVDNFAMPINEAFALNYQSYYSIAIADADQTVIIGQLDVDGDGTP